MLRLALKLAAVLALVGLIPLGCGGGGGQDGLAPVQLAFSNPTLFTTGLPYYVAQDQGFYEEAGLEVEATFTEGGATTVQAIVSGSADIATENSAPSVLSPYVQGAPIKIVSASTTGLDLFWYSNPDSPYRDLDDLAGQTVGYSSTGSSSHIGVLALNEDLIAAGQEELVPEAVGGATDNLTAVQTGQIAAGWSQAPFLLSEVEDGQYTIVAQGSQLEEYEDVAVRVNTVNTEYAEENPESVRTFLEVQQRAWDWIFENPEEAVSIWKEAAGLEESEEVLLTSFDYYDRENLRLAPLDGQEKILEDAREFGFLEEDLSEEQINELFDTSYVPEER